MSLVPSKRMDRIYPVLPPLCLVLTALIARALRPPEPLPPSPDTPLAPPPTLSTPPPHWPLDWAKLALAVAVAVPCVDAVKSVAQVYRRHEDAPSRFGAAGPCPHLPPVIPSKWWSVATTSLGEETMIVYLRRLRFLTPGDADRLARAGQLDAVIINARSLDYARGLLGRVRLPPNSA